ncbi:MAG: hypothetical protein ACREPB_12790, partial [Arenimonas sp.]
MRASETAITGANGSPDAAQRNPGGDATSIENILIPTRWRGRCSDFRFMASIPGLRCAASGLQFGSVK